MMKKIFSVILAGLVALAFIPIPVDASVRINVNDSRSGFADTINLEGLTTLERTGNTVTIDVVDSTMIAAGAANGGATTMSTTTVAVPVTFAYVNATISSDPAFVAKTLADGKAGQILTFHIVTDEGTETLTITPTTSTGFSVASFDAVDDQATFLFVSSTVGWIVMSQTSVTLTP